MRTSLFFFSILCVLAIACSDAPPAENTINETAAVNTEALPKTAISTEPAEKPAPQDKEKPEPVVEAPSTSQTAAAPQPPAERPRAKGTAKKTVAPPSSKPAKSGPSTPKKEPAKTPAAKEDLKKAPAPAGPAAPQIVEKKKAQAPPSFSHEAWDGLLKKYVSSSGKVNYKGLKAEKAKLDAYLEALKNNPPQSSWGRDKTMAYWINVYNAFTVKLIVDNYPVASITKLNGGKPWDKNWIKIGSKTYSLNNIENDILRPKYKDARIHFAVNCAARSCPPLLNRAWTAGSLNSNFEKRAKAFINNPKYNPIAADKVKVSKIFEWYAADFGDLIGFLNRYSSTKINADAKVEYLEYDWNLNE